MGTGIPVPPVIPEGSKAFTVCVPDDPFFYGVVMGLLKQATFKYFWAGTDEQKTAVTDRMLEMYYGYQDQAGCMDCDQIADCIENDAATQAAIAEAITSNTLIQNAINNVYNPVPGGGTMPPEVSGQNVTGPNPTCNLDALWGYIDTGIESMNAANRDSQEVIETLSQPAERLATLLSAIPGVGILPVDEIVAYGQGLWSDDLFTAYVANDTAPYRTQLKCDLFCIARDAGCVVSVDMLVDLFLDRLSFSGAKTLDYIVSYLVAGTWVGTEINDTFYLAQALWLKYGDQFFHILGLPGIGILFGLGEPSDDWTLLCDCPEFWEHTIDFTASNGGFEAFVNEGIPRALWVDGSGWGRAGTGDAVQMANIQIQRAGLSSFNIQLMRITCTEAPTLGYQFRMNDVSGGAYASGLVGAGNTTHDITLDNTGTGMWLNAADNDGENMSGFMTTLYMTGTGTNPFL